MEEITKLTVTDFADESVGIFQSSYTIETPISEGDDQEDIEAFRNMAIELYSNFSFGKVIARYDFEIRKIQEDESLLP